MAKDTAAPRPEHQQPVAAIVADPGELAALRQQVVALQAQVAALVDARGGAAPAPSGTGPGSPEYSAFTLFVEQQADQIRQEHESRRRHEELREWNGKSCQERTQALADRQFAGPRTFLVSIPRDKVQPAVKIRAHSEAEALGHYQALCGIRGTEHPIVAAPAAA